MSSFYTGSGMGALCNTVCNSDALSITADFLETQDLIIIMLSSKVCNLAGVALSHTMVAWGGEKQTGPTLHMSFIFLGSAGYPECVLVMGLTEDKASPL